MTFTNWEITFERLVYGISYKIHQIMFIYRYILKFQMSDKKNDKYIEKNDFLFFNTINHNLISRKRKINT